MKKKPTSAKILKNKIESEHLRELAKKIKKVPDSINIPVEYRDLLEDET